MVSLAVPRKISREKVVRDGRSDSRYWQVARLLRAPKRLSFVHGRFSWEKKTFYDFVIMESRKCSLGAEAVR